MQHINVQEFEKVLQSNKYNPTIDCIDVCTTSEYNKKHIPGVRSVPLGSIHNHLSEFKDKKTIYVHCKSGNRSQQAIQTLQSLGITADFVNVTGGLHAWDETGLETTSIYTRIPIAQQILLTAGAFVTAGVILALVVNPLFIFLPLLIGLGLMFMGSTGWDGAARLFAKMPWNTQ